MPANGGSTIIGERRVQDNSGTALRHEDSADRYWCEGASLAVLRTVDINPAVFNPERILVMGKIQRVGERSSLHP